MRKKEKFLVLVSMICIALLSCNLTRNLPLYLAGLQGQVEQLTNVANPVGLPTPDPNSTSTLEPTPPPETTPTLEASPIAEPLDMVGLWRGTSQWLCDNSPPMDTSMEFMSSGSLRAVFTLQGQESVIKDATWVLSADRVTIHAGQGVMTGTVSGDSISGSFEEHSENFDCQGTWSVTRQ